MTRFLSVFIHEFKYHLIGKALWVFYLILGAFALTAVSSDEMSLGGVASVYLNAPYSVTILTGVLTLASLFILAAAVAGSVVRDFETRYGDILAATPVSGISVVLGRFMGAISATLLGFWVVLAFMAIAPFMPWVDTQRMGPVPWQALLAVYVYLTIPVLVSLGAILFALATIFRTMAAAMVGVIAIVGGYLAALSNRFINGNQDLVALLDPTGLVALAKQSDYWTIAQRNTGHMQIVAGYLENRVLWVVIGGIALLLSVILYQRGLRESARPLISFKTKSKQAAPRKAQYHHGVQSSFGQTSFTAQLLMRMRHDLAAVLKSASFWALFLVCISVTWSSLSGVGEQNGAAMYPVTRLLVRSLNEDLLPLMMIVAAYYGGALVWRERDGRVHELVGATGISNWTFVIPKVLAVAIAIFMMAIACMVAGILSQLAKGFVAPDMANWFVWWLLPAAIAGLQVACLSVFSQAISPNRFVGWGLLIAVLIGPSLFAHWGGGHSLLQFAFAGEVPLSDFNGMAHFWITRLWYQLLWGAASICLVILAWAFWKRGTETRFRPRLATLRDVLKGPVLVGLAVSSATFAGLVGWIFYNTNIANYYFTPDQSDAYEVQAEKDLGKYARMPMPVVVDVKLDLDIDTKKLTAKAKGRYVLQNQTDKPLSDLVINWPGEEPLSLTVEDASRSVDLLKEHIFEVWRFKRPMQPGEKRVVTFEVMEDNGKFEDDNAATDIVENGTFFRVDSLVPDFGISDHYFLSDPTTRRKYGLPPKPRMPAVDDAFAKTRSFYSVDAGFVNSDISVTMPSDQIVVVPGKQVSQTTTNGRTTTRFVSEAPMTAAFAVLAARYKVHTEQILANGKPVTLSIYHLPQHDKNITRMARAAKISLDLFAKEFGPYPYSTLKIAEVPGYGGDVAAEAMAGVIPFYEDIGWLQVDKPDDQLDNVSSTTAHEIAHMWWGHQILPSSNAGAQVLSESLAEYSALYAMIYVRSYNQAVDELRNGMSAYRRERGDDPIGENPLGQAEGQQYLVYNRGAASFWLLKDQMGKEALHRALAKFVAQYRYAQSIYPGTPELMAALKSEAAPAQQKLIDMLFNKIVFFDFKAAATTVKLDLKTGIAQVFLKAKASAAFFAGDGTKLNSTPISGVADVYVPQSRPANADNEGKNRDSRVVFAPRVRFDGDSWEIATVKGFWTDPKSTIESVAPDMHGIWFSDDGQNSWAPVTLSKHDSQNAVDVFEFNPPKATP